MLSPTSTHSNSHPPQRFRTAVSWIAAGLICVACTKHEGKSTSQVAIKINGEEVSVHQADLAVQRQTKGVAQGQIQAATSRALEGLVDQELAAQAARKEALDRDPRVIQMLEASKREVLARAYLDGIAERVVEPTSDEIDVYYQAHPALFSERRQYSLQETIVSLQGTELDPLKVRLQTTRSPEKMIDALHAGGHRFTARHISVSAEDVPLSVLDQLAALQEGQSLVLGRDGGARILTVLQAQASPIHRAAASKLIAMYLLNERKGRALKQGLKSLRDPAKIEYVGRYSQIAESAASGSPAADQSVQK